MYIHFGYIGENLKVNIFLSPGLQNAFTDEIYLDTETDDKNSPNFI